jgi:hypothetical protein
MYETYLVPDVLNACMPPNADEHAYQGVWLHTVTSSYAFPVKLSEFNPKIFVHHIARCGVNKWWAEARIIPFLERCKLPSPCHPLHPRNCKGTWRPSKGKPKGKVAQEKGKGKAKSKPAPPSASAHSGPASLLAPQGTAVETSSPATKKLEEGHPDQASSGPMELDYSQGPTDMESLETLTAETHAAAVAALGPPPLGGGSMP